MAEEKKETGSSIDSWNLKLIIGLILLLILPGVFAGRGVVDVLRGGLDNKNDIEQLELRKQPWFSVSNLVGRGNLSLGKIATVSKDVKVRTYPGGSVLGVQEKLVDGKLVEGPVNQFGTLWWRVNFEKAPSGWVEFENLTVRSKTIKIIYLPQTIYKAYKPFGWLLTVLLLLLIFVLKLKLNHEYKIFSNRIKVQDEQAEKNKKQKASESRSGLGIEDGPEFRNSRWEHVKELMKSKSQNDWRQAIIEADIILDEMLRRMSYKGLTIGDMLKQVDPADFANLQKAWDAHKFRNEIAHTGSEFKISKEEADRVIALYQAVFEEFYYI